MKKRLSWVLAAALALSLIAQSAAMASPSASSPVAAATQGLEKIAAEKAALLTESYGTISVQYALIDNGKITVSGQTGMNDMEGKKPLTKETMYGIGSTSKVFTAAAVMKLADDGKIDLDAPLVRYIPDFTMKDERYKQITPRMLLNHSSGLQGSSLGSSFLFEDNDTYAHDTLLKQLSAQSLKADPGAFSVYCNDGFTLAEILVERVSGMDFTAFIHKYFTQPLQMNHTKTSQDELEASKMAGLYYPVYQGQLPNETVNVIGTGGIYSTAEDLARFSQLFTGQANGILSDKAVQAMAQEEYKKGLWPEDTDNIFNYGLGWDSVKLFPFNEYGIQGLAKGGDTILYHASLVVLPEQNMAAAVLSSGGSSSLNQLLLQALKEKGAIKNIKPEKSFGKPVKAEMPAEVAKHAGYYGTIGQHIEIEIKKDGELSLPLTFMLDNSKEKYVYTADGSFVNESGTSKVSFVTEKNGRTYLWIREYVTMPGLGQLAMSHYAAEKLEDNELPKETAKAWEKREGTTFYPVSEKYTSLMYLIMQPTIQIPRTDELPGYLGDKKITGPNTAASQLQIPGMAGRDMAEFRFFKQDGVEYMKVSGSLYVSGAKVKPLYAGKESKLTLQANGHARWFTVPKSAAGKTMTVALPAKGAFAVYDEQGLCVNFTVVSGNNEVMLPENGTIVFAGAPGSEFGIALK
ncbi:beta-lactamase family protein [Paenibacillus melissococcoides]|uniref:Beta-lactamase family protein n=1 Tax=Paenibacillus melissococcoides TaxID=2912268 RepID=A0ABM9FYI7_9BACL|nr:serine hydrolase domain-containing protein [Paenibacillus melissococcoides]CAH8244283.1 beta-lactamase family protein [Paenibacillus melissococcoides]CAH8703511.1 beta-lactamase family protein [Paenibacillus melissococcoides]CAH8705928.1 beta-lactamase family protein [Paenibacillus melissococcoides]